MLRTCLRSMPPYWPALYIVDKEGSIRHAHFGEGGYVASERVLQRLLGVEHELVSVGAVSRRRLTGVICAPRRHTSDPDAEEHWQYRATGSMRSLSG